DRTCGPDLSGQRTAGCWHDRPGRVRAPEGQSTRLGDCAPPSAWATAALPPRASSGSGRDEPGLVGCDHGLGAVVYADLREDSFHVRLDRLEAHIQRVRDLTVRQTMSDEHEYLALASR